MPNDKADTQVVIAANTSAAEADLRSLARTLTELTDVLKNRVQKEGTEAFHGVTGALREFKSEQVQQGRLVGFYVREFTEFADASRETQSIMSGLGSVVAEIASASGPFAALFIGLEAGKFIVKTAWEEWHRYKEEIALVATAQRDANLAWAHAHQVIGDLTRVETEGTKAARQAAKEMLPDLQALNETYDKLREKGAGWLAYLRDAIMDTDRMGSSVGEYEEKLKAVNDQIERGNAAMRHAADMAAVLKSGSMDAGAGAPAGGKEAAKNNAELERAREQLAITRLTVQTRAVGLSEQEVEQARHLLELEKLRIDIKHAANQAQRATIQLLIDEENAHHKANMAQIEAKDAPQLGPSEKLFETDKEDAKKKLHQQMVDFNREVENWERGYARASAAAQQYGAVGEQVGRTLEQAFTGAMTPLRATKTILAEVMNSVIEAAKKQILADAAVSAAEAFKSQAGIPVAGPLLAAGAEVAALSAIQALIGDLPSAAGGASIKLGVNPVYQLHGGEDVIPKDIAQRYRAGAPGSGGRTTVNVYTPDSKSFDQYLRSNDSTLMRVIRDAQRKGV